MGVPNALAGLVTSLDDELGWLIARYGGLAVREAANRLSKQKVGRKAEKDGRLLKPWHDQDADDWLVGLDPFKLRTNYSIARDFSEKHPGHSRIATHKRISRKLRTNRRLIMLLLVRGRTEAHFSHSVHFRALRELAATDPRWSFFLDAAVGKIERYRARFGDPPDDISLSQIDQKNQEPDQSTLGGILAQAVGQGSI